MPSQAEMQGMMEFARQALNPAAQILAHRAELAITPAQAVALDSLAAPMNLFLNEHMKAQMTPASAAVMRVMTDPNAEIDEAAIRAGYREQADKQAELIIRMVRLERQVGQLLTPEQREKRQTLQLNSMMGMMRAMGSAVTPAP
jgi:hypothetical protein